MHIFFQKPNIIAFVLLMALGFLVYANTLTNAFVWTDQFHILDKALIIQDKFDLIHSFTSFYYPERLGFQKSGYYRPLMKASLTLDYFFWKEKPFGYHFTNIILHALNTILVYLVILGMFKDYPASLFSAILFGLHPLHTSVVGVVSHRSDLLLGFFIFLAFWAHLRQKRLLSFVSFCFALLSKESAVIFPLLVALYDYLFTRRADPVEFKKRIKYNLVFFLISGIYISYRFLFLGQLSAGQALFWGKPYRVILTMPVVFADYLRLLILPIRLTLSDASILYRAFCQPPVFGSVILFLFLIILVVKYRKIKELGFSLGWFFITLLPAANIIPAKHFRAERFLYLAVFSLCLAFALLFTKRGRKSKLVVISLVVIILTFGILTRERNRDFRDDLVLFSKTLKASPYCFEAYAVLGNYYLERNDYRRAIMLYNQVFKIGPDYIGFNNLFEVHNNLGVAYMFEGFLKESIREFLKAKEIEPQSSMVYFNLGTVYHMNGQDEEAILFLKKALEFDPKYPLCHSYLGRLYAKKGLLEEAKKYWQEELEVNPGERYSLMSLEKLPKMNPKKQ